LHLFLRVQSVGDLPNPLQHTLHLLHGLERFVGGLLRGDLSPWQLLSDALVQDAKVVRVLARQ
jgi:hypothetical protein